MSAASGTHAGPTPAVTPHGGRSDDAEPRRMTPTERLHEVTMAAMSRRPAEPEHTVGLTLNAKGDVQIEVTGRGHDLDALVNATSEHFDALRARYPRNGAA